MIKIMAISNRKNVLAEINSKLIPEDYAFKASESGIESLEIFKKDPDDVIIIDITLKDTDIIELIKSLKKIEKDTEIIAFSSCPCNPSLIHSAYNEGIFCLLPKEDFTGLDILVEKAFERRKLNSQLKDNITLLINALEEKTRELKLRKRAEKKLEENLEEARNSHKKLLNINYPKVHNMRFHYNYIPYEVVGGDFFNILKNKNRIFFYLCDISGHGVESAILAATLKSSIDRYILDNEISSPSGLIKEIVKSLKNNDIFEKNLLTIYCGMINLDDLTLQYISAGHLLPIITSDDKEENEMPSGKGTYRAITNILPTNIDEYNDITIYLDNSSKIFLFSDGLIEWVNEEGVFEGLSEFKKYFKNSGINSSLIENLINKKVAGNQNDDISYMLIEIYNSYEKLYYCSLNDYNSVINDFEIELKSRYSSDKKIYRTIQSFTEIITNAIEHGNKNLIYKKIIVKTEFNKDTIVFSVEDEGEGFDWKKVNFDAVRNEDDLRGRGLYIVKRYSDKFIFNEKGNMITVTNFID